MSVTVATANWNGFWGLYGDKWSGYIKAMSPAPDRVIVASDEPIDTDFEVVICKTKKLGPMRNAALEICNTEWFVPSDLDDIPLPCYIKDLNSDFDIHSYSLMWGGSLLSHNQEEWDKAFELDAPNPLVSCSAFKSELGKKVRYRDIGWEDWAFWLDMKKANAKVFHDKTPRYIYTHGALSREGIAQKDQEIKNLKMSGVW